MERLSAEQLLHVTDTIRTAARIPQDRALTPQQVHAACAQGLEAIFRTGERE